MALLTENFVSGPLLGGIDSSGELLEIHAEISERIPFVDLAEDVDQVPATLWDGQQEPELVYITDNPQNGFLTVIRGAEQTLPKAWREGTVLRLTISRDMVLAATNGVTSVNGQTGDVVLTKDDIGLDMVDNTADIDKPVSTATQTAIDALFATILQSTLDAIQPTLDTLQETIDTKAPIDSPSFIGPFNVNGAANFDSTANFVGAVTIQGALVMPVGSIKMWPSLTPPTGWLECGGQPVSRMDYPVLFTAIGTIFGPGDGVTTFNLPNFRGVVPRGVDNGRGLDTGRLIGSYQADGLAEHNHIMFKTTNGNVLEDIGENPTFFATSFTDNGDENNNYRIKGTEEEPDSGVTADTGEAETRVKSIATLFIIRVG